MSKFHEIFCTRQAVAMLSPRLYFLENINKWTALPVEESIRMTEDGDKCRAFF